MEQLLLKDPAMVKLSQLHIAYLKINPYLNHPQASLMDFDVIRIHLFDLQKDINDLLQKQTELIEKPAYHHDFIVTLQLFNNILDSALIMCQHCKQITYHQRGSVFKYRKEIEKRNEMVDWLTIKVNSLLQQA